MARIVLLCPRDERITVRCPPFRATLGQCCAVVNQTSFLNSHSIVIRGGLRLTTGGGGGNAREIFRETRSVVRASRFCEFQTSGLRERKNSISWWSVTLLGRKRNDYVSREGITHRGQTRKETGEKLSRRDSRRTVDISDIRNASFLCDNRWSSETARHVAGENDSARGKRTKRKTKRKKKTAKKR